MVNELIRDDEGVSIGGTSSYVDRFKRLAEGTGSIYDEPKVSPKEVNLNTKVLPTEWNPQTEKEVLLHYYRRMGDCTGNDFKEISGKIAATINRLFKQNFNSETMLIKLVALITKTDLETVVQQKPKTIVIPEVKINITLKNRDYPFKTNLEALETNKIELCNIIDCKSLAFTCKDGTFKLGCAQKDNLCELDTQMSPREKIMFEMFKEQLGDEIKAKKLIFMSRMAETLEVKPKTKKIKVQKIETLLEKDLNK